MYKTAKMHSNSHHRSALLAGAATVLLLCYPPAALASTRRHWHSETFNPFPLETDNFNRNFHTTSHQSFGQHSAGGDSFPRLYFGQVMLPRDYITAGSRRGRARSQNQLTKSTSHLDKGKRTVFHSEVLPPTEKLSQAFSTDQLVKVSSPFAAGSKLQNESPHTDQLVDVSPFLSVDSFKSPDYKSIAHEANGRAQAAVQSVDLITRLARESQKTPPPTRVVHQAPASVQSMTKDKRHRDGFQFKESSPQRQTNSQSWKITSPAAIKKLQQSNGRGKQQRLRTLQKPKPSRPPFGRQRRRNNSPPRRQRRRRARHVGKRQPF